MAYADREVSGNRIVAFIIVALLHVLLVYALVTGLAYEAIKKVAERVTAVDIKKDEPKKEPPPPPKKVAAPPPIVAPPPKINVAIAPPPVQTVVTPPPVAPVVPVLAPPAPVPAPPPPPRVQAKPATPRGNPASWANNNDYPSRALREEKEGVTRFRVSVGPDGRVTGCEVTSSSGSDELDNTTCSLITRRARFNPAIDGEGNPTSSSWASSVRWQIPKD